ncbi:MAG: hypothetical protein H7Z72_01420 [Bacteroidetes bacterium]|nr:hypothetical protein [Fibrella sp.]
MENLPQPEKQRPEDAAANRDNSTHDEFENVANPLGPGSESDDPGQDGRNIRAFGSTDQDGANGVLRMNDQDNSTMEVTPEAEKSIVGSTEQTNTSTVTLTTAGPDDDASADETPVPDAQKEAKKAAADGDTDANDSDTNASVSQQKKEDDVAQTGTSLDFQPAA